MKLKGSGGEDCEGGDQIAETLTLDEHVLAQTFRRQIAISRENRGDDAVMLGKGACDTIAHPELQTPVHA